MPQLVQTSWQPVLRTAATTPAVTVERRAGLSRRAFEHEYSLPRRPVILTDATEHWKAREWTPESLCRRVGQREIKFRGGAGTMRFERLCRHIEAASEDTPAPYGRNIDIFRDLPELADDVRPRIAYCQGDWKSSRLLPKDWLFPNGLEEMFFGGRGTKFPVLHVDYWGMDAFISQLYGQKEVIVFAPEDTDFLYPREDDPLSSGVSDLDAPDLARFPRFLFARPIRLTLEPGETLFCPNGWWHTTSMPGTSISVVTANWGRGNWDRLIAQYRWHRRSPRVLRKLRTEAIAAYLRCVGVALSLRDRWVLGQ